MVTIKLKEYKNDMKKTWNILNDVTRRKNKNSNSNDEFNSGSNLMTNKTEISNHFNNFVANIGPYPWPGKYKISMNVISISFLHVI